MGYHYTDPKRASEPHALPDVEVFEYTDLDAKADGFEVYDREGNGDFDPEAQWFAGPGWYFAFGFPGCLWDSEPEGPYESEADALAAAREVAGWEVDDELREAL